MDNVLKERTLIVIKPDAIRRALNGVIIKKFEDVGLKLIAVKMIKASREQILSHYPVTDESWVRLLGEKTLKTFDSLKLNVKEKLGTDDPLKLGQDVVEKLVEHWSEGPVIIMIWEGPHAIEVARKLRGVTTPLQAEPGSILGDLSFDSQLVSNTIGRAMKTFVHASGEVFEADREIKHWFGEEATFYDYYNRTDHTAML
ncbi:MAG: nucleoside-diphosphate kinase [bacterium]|nr:nucleoside-diphosphate kinase [bacterium]